MKSFRKYLKADESLPQTTVRFANLYEVGVRDKFTLDIGNDVPHFIRSGVGEVEKSRRFAGIKDIARSNANLLVLNIYVTVGEPVSIPAISYWLRDQFYPH